MAPGEQDNKEFVDDIGIGDVEVVLETANIDIAIKLDDVRAWVFGMIVCSSIRFAPCTLVQCSERSCRAEHLSVQSGR